MPFTRTIPNYRVVRLRPPRNVSVVWTIDEFTEQNGATFLMPGSHLSETYESPDLPMVQATVPPGSVIIWDGATWYGAGFNRSDKVRRAIIFTHCRAWLRPQENLSLLLSRETVRAMPRALQRLCGGGSWAACWGK